MKRKLFAILMMLTLVLTYMPAVAFADDGDEPEDRGNPVSIEFIHDGDYEVEGFFTTDGFIDEETGEWIQTSDPYYYFNCPGFSIGDVLEVTYENEEEPVRYIYTEGNDDDCQFIAEGTSDDFIFPDIDWAREQSYSNQFEADTNEEIIIALESYGGDSDDPIILQDTASAYLYINDGPDEPDEEKDWWLNYDSETVIFKNGKADLAVEVEEDYGTPAGTYTYKWCKWSDTAGEDGDYVAISGATKNTYTATELGDYCCIVTRDNGETSTAYFYVNTWAAKGADDDIILVQGGTEVLKVELTGNVPTNLTYKWFKGDGDDEEQIPGDGDSIEVDSAGEYCCEIYEGDNEEPSEYAYFTVVQIDREWDISPVEDEVDIPVGKKAKLEINVKGNTEGLKYQWVKVLEEEGDNISYTNISGAAGTSYETSESGVYRCYAYTHDGPIEYAGEDGDAYVSFWVDNETAVVNGVGYDYCDGTAIATNWDRLEGAISIASSVKFSDGKTYPVTGIGDFSYNKITSVNIPASVRFIEGDAFASTSLTSVTIPATVENIGEHAFGYNYVSGSGEGEYSKVSGFVIYGKTGTAAERYAKANGFKFVDRDAEAAAAAAKAKADAEAKAKAKAAADEAARQGVYDSSLPKVKVSKPATKKATVTAKWKKLNKKQLKKSKATHYEIWICENKGFAKGLTKEKIVKKGKASFKFTGLKKNTKYYVQVRAITYVNGVKHVGKWSQKSIKTKKK